MTGYTVHTGSNEKFSSGWDQIFKTQPAPAKKAAKASESASPKKAGAKKTAVKATSKPAAKSAAKPTDTPAAKTAKASKPAKKKA